MTGLRDCVIKFSTYFYFIFKISLKTFTNTQSNVTGRLYLAFGLK